MVVDMTPPSAKEGSEADVEMTPPTHDTIELYCGVYGTPGDVVVVKKRLDETVGSVRETLAGELGVRAHALTLSLAKKKKKKEGEEEKGEAGEDEWVASGKTLKNFLLSGPVKNASGETEFEELWVGDDLSEHFVVPMPRRAVHVLVERTEGSTMIGATIPWEMTASPCPVLSYDQESPIIHIPQVYAQDSGLLVGEQGVRLFLRQALREEWLVLLKGAVSTFAVIWVVGPPGTGKSCAAFAFACSLDRSSGWDVVWIHCSDRLGDMLWCIRFCGEASKETCMINYARVGELLSSLSEKAVVFLDGYVNSHTAARTSDTCKGWHAADAENRRLVIVSSMVSRGKSHRDDHSLAIPSVVPSGLTSLAVSAPSESGTVLDEQRFTMSSWTLEEFQAAVSNDVFFEHVRKVLTESSGELTVDERGALVKAKFFFVGGSARLMFDMPVEGAKKTLVDAMEAVPDITPYVEGSVGIYSDKVANRLLSWYPPSLAAIKSGGSSLPGPASAFVARELAFRLPVEKLLNLARCLVKNASMDGYVLEVWFFASLCHGGAVLFSPISGRSCDVWRMESGDGYGHDATVSRFDPQDGIPLDVSEQWLAPTKWNQGGYDAVYVEMHELKEREKFSEEAKQEGRTTKFLVRFVQVTRATTHSFKTEYFKDLLSRVALSYGRSLWVYKVEVFFVVPIAVMNDFRLPADEMYFRRECLDPAFESALPTEISLEVRGLKYEMFEEKAGGKRVRI